MSRSLCASVLLALLAGCASEPEGWKEDHVLAGLDYGSDGVHRERGFEPPPPLKPQVVDGTPDQVKPAWKTPPVRVTTRSPTTGMARLEQGGSSLDAQAALDAQEQEAQARAAARRKARRLEARKHRRKTHAELTRRQRSRQARFDEAEDALEEREAAEVQSIVDDLRRVCAGRAPGVIDTKAKELLESMRARADRFGLRAQRARRKADLANQFADSSSAQGVMVQGALRDAQRAEQRAVDYELEALKAEAEAHWAALAQRRVMLGKLDSPD